ncbi:hypothetical protein [Lentzea cavernae]|uniref:hypothetical protein n=1 Tax=Lentzea cavernae TaxID=2020703 RepID=UPI00174D1304|nr:hypothetical protein [Lentzea cavernae]
MIAELATQDGESVARHAKRTSTAAIVPDDERYSPMPVNLHEHISRHVQGFMAHMIAEDMPSAASKVGVISKPAASSPSRSSAKVRVPTMQLSTSRARRASVPTSEMPI